MPSLVLENVTKSFAESKVLDRVSLELHEGELMVLLGPSGCGKSTLLRLIAGLEALDDGRIYLGGCRLDTLQPKHRNVAMVFQNYALYPHMTVQKNLAFPLTVAGIKKDIVKQRVRDTASILGLGDRLQDRPSQLSGGQRQRVALGRAIIRRPALFLLDEPLSNLDADLRARMRREIVRIQRLLETTTMYVTHDQTEALTMADRLAVLHDGCVAQVGSPQELYRNPASLFVAEFIGQPRINVIAVDSHEQLQTLVGSPVADRLSVRRGESIKLGLRPEAIEISETGEHLGVVNSCEYLGDQYVISLASGKMNVTISGHSVPLPVGEQVHFTFSPKALLFFDGSTGRRLVLA